MADLGDLEPRIEPLPIAARLHIWQFQAVRDVLFIIAVVGIIWVGYTIRAVTIPLLIALTLAYLFEPLIAWLTKKHNISRPMAVGGLLLSVGLVVVLVLAIAIPLIIGQSISFVRDVRAGRFQNTLIRMKEYIPEKLRSDYESTVAWLVPGADIQTEALSTQPATSPVEPAEDAALLMTDDRVRQIVHEELAVVEPVREEASIWDWARSGLETVAKLIGGVVSIGLLAFLIPFYFFFFSVSYPSVVRFGRNLIPVANRQRVFELISKMDRAVAGFVRGRIVICLIMGVMLAIGWWACGVPYSIVLGFLIGAFSIVPYLGGIGIPLAVGLLAIHQMNLPAPERMEWWAIILWPCVVFGFVQVIETYILTPSIAGKATNLDPVTILVAVLAGGSVGGVYGMLLAIPVAACLKILITDVLLPKIRAWTKGEVEDPLPI